jgi:hypothetical protein
MRELKITTVPWLQEGTFGTKVHPEQFSLLLLSVHDGEIVPSPFHSFLLRRRRREPTKEKEGKESKLQQQQQKQPGSSSFAGRAEKAFTPLPDRRLLAFK